MTESDRTRSVEAILDDVTADDPRVNEKYLRQVQLDDRAVVLVGVVHDHPASIHRVQTVVDALAPEAVAIELPSLLVPTLATRDDDTNTGGEMAAAVKAAPTESASGIDVPGRGLYRAFQHERRARGPGVGTMVDTLRSVGSLTARALVGRLAHELGNNGVDWLPTVADLEDDHTFDLQADADAADQADNEAAHLLRSETMLRTLDPPAATTFLDGVREQFMADRLRAMRAPDVAVGVVGYAHLDSVTEKLRTESG